MRLDIFGEDQKMIVDDKAFSDVNPITDFDDGISKAESSKQKKKDLSLLNEQTLAYLQSDKQKLQEDLEQAQKVGDMERVSSLKCRLRRYYIVINFFVCLAEHSCSTQLQGITTEILDDYIKYRCLLSSQTALAPPKLAHTAGTRQRDQQELKAFFDRAKQAGVIQCDKEFAVFNQTKGLSDVIPKSKLSRQTKKAISLLNEQTLAYLQFDKQKLWDDLKQSQQVVDIKQVRSLKSRLENYFVIINFFTCLVKQGHSTQLQDITTEMLEDYIKYRYPLSSRTALAQPKVVRPDQACQRYKRELKNFFDRAEKVGVLPHNPTTLLTKPRLILEPKNPSSQTLADCQAFQNYLQRRVEINLLTPGTARNHYNRLLMLLHDSEQQHSQNPDWPNELDSLLANPKWVWEWLNNLNNRSRTGINANKRLAFPSIRGYLRTIFYLWRFLKNQGRVTETYYQQLEDMFKLPSILRPRIVEQSSKTGEPLSEDEEEAVLQYIKERSPHSILVLRDRAFFITAIETTMPIRKLSQMRIEDFKNLESGAWIYQFEGKHLDQVIDPDFQQASSQDNLPWYISLQAIETISNYLDATDRDWSSKGPLWLTLDRRPISHRYQAKIISDCLKGAGCRSTRPHILRRTGIDRLLHKEKFPPDIVQAISHYGDLDSLLGRYGRPTTTDMPPIEE